MKKYKVILADPPWRLVKGGKKKARPNTSGKPLEDEISIWKIRFYGLLVFLLIIGFLALYNKNYGEPKGIGGFVYKEIEWADQTYNVIKGNNCLYIDYEPIEKKIYCRHQECKGEYCKYDNLYFPVNEVGSS